MAEVDDAQIDQAYQSILALEVGDGLVNQIVEQRFWRKYLKSRYPREFAQNSVVYNSRSRDLLNRHLAGAVSKHEYERLLIELAEGRNALLKRLSKAALDKV